MKDYQKEAQDIASAIGLKMTVEFLKHDFHFQGDKDKRDIYKITLIKGSRSYSFNFGQSINCSGKFWVGYKMAGNVRHRAAKPFNDIKEAKIEQFLGSGFSIQKNENFEEPDFYSVLSCLTKYDPGTFEDFCSEFGYDSDSRSAEKTYKAVKDEYTNVIMLFNDEEIQQLQEIN